MSLWYRFRRYLAGEYGVVEKVESIDMLLPGGEMKHGKPPQIVTFRNPLGEVKRSIRTYAENKEYKHYEPGDKFP